MSDVLAPPNPSSATPHGSSQDEQVRDVAVSVAAQGRTTTAASLRVASLTSRARFKRAAKTSAMLLGLAVASLPIPPVHWLLVPGFLIAAIISFFVRLRTGALADGQITCPKCQGNFAIETQPPAWPLLVTCHHCRAQLTVAPIV